MNRYTPNGDVPRSPWTDWSSQWPAASASCARWEDPNRLGLHFGLLGLWNVILLLLFVVFCGLKVITVTVNFPLPNIRCVEHAPISCYWCQIESNPNMCYIKQVKWCSKPKHYVHFILYILDLCSSRLVSFWVANCKFWFFNISMVWYSSEGHI